MRRFLNTMAVAFSAIVSSGLYAKNITAVMTLQEKTSMTQLAAKVMDPHSDRYGKFYSPEEIRNLVAPSDEDYNALLTNLEEEGFTILTKSSSHLVVTVSGDHTLFAKIFQTPIQFTKNNQHMNTHMVRIPEQFSLVRSITGLDNTHKLKPQYRIHNIQPLSKDQPGILPAQIKTAYGFDPLYQEGLTGKGQSIAIAAFMDFPLMDVKAYFKKVGLKTQPKVDKIVFNGKLAYDKNAAIETALDAEFAGMIAPGADIHIFAASHNDDAGELAVFTAILDDNRAKQVNYSWGDCETNISSTHKNDMDQIFTRAVAQGVNILVASGDAGVDGCQNNTVAADWPAAHPGIVAVGGTSLTLDKKNNTILSELGWKGSGGGISQFYPLPSWQSNFQTPFVRRSFPDVAFNADPTTGEAIWMRATQFASPKWVQVGGTSMAAPQWVGFLALVNEAREKAGLPTLGFLNPRIYSSTADQKAVTFRDTITGSNGGYTAGPGWDAVSGWGSMQGQALKNFLMAP